MPATFEWESRFELAKRIARQAGQLTLAHFQSRDLQVIRKGDGSPVTAADQESERFLRTEIARHFPEDKIVGEEYGISPGTSGLCWALDPIDGTKSFITGVPLYGTMVAVIDQRSTVTSGTADQPEQDGQPGTAGQAIIGAIYLPGLDEGIYAATGQGAWHYRHDQPPNRARVSDTDRMSEAVILSSSIEGFPKRGDGSSFERLSQKVRFARTWGDVYGYFLVATGRADIMIDPEMNIWDAAAVQPIIEEAGGRFTDWKNNAIIDGGDSIGSNGKLHDELLDLLSATKTSDAS